MKSIFDRDGYEPDVFDIDEEDRTENDDVLYVRRILNGIGLKHVVKNTMAGEESFN